MAETQTGFVALPVAVNLGGRGGASRPHQPRHTAPQGPDAQGRSMVPHFPPGSASPPPSRLPRRRSAPRKSCDGAVRSSFEQIQHIHVQSRHIVRLCVVDESLGQGRTQHQVALYDGDEAVLNPWKQKLAPPVSLFRRVLASGPAGAPARVAIQWIDHRTPSDNG